MDQQPVQRLRLGNPAMPSRRVGDLLLIDGGSELLPWFTVENDGRALAAVGPLRADGTGSDWPRLVRDFLVRWTGQVRAPNAFSIDDRTRGVH